MPSILHKKLGLIGVGNMGTSILEGLIQKKLVSPAEIFVYDKLKEKAEAFAKKFKCWAVSSNQEIVKKADVILLAVKPQDLAATAAEFGAALKPSHVVISILAGTPIDKLRKIIGTKVKIVRTMPNLGAQVGSSITAITGADADAVELAQKIFSGCGETAILEEKYFDAVTALSGSGPAYFFYLMELLTEEGIRYGLSAEQAALLAVCTAQGAGKLAYQQKQKGETPQQLRQKVTSKGGTTEAALKVLIENNLPDLFARAIKAAYQRGKELSQ